MKQRDVVDGALRRHRVCLAGQWPHRGPYYCRRTQCLPRGIAGRRAPDEARKLFLSAAEEAHLTATELAAASSGPWRELTVQRCTLGHHCCNQLEMTCRTRRAPYLYYDWAGA
ncbi:DUF982 domain-containing protein [Ensifer adhaerens]|uniref:DUF982 domain-containing protein n=1 Tax=Ensifer adhaerens TaxID=106592 RepID=UPI0009E92D36|nr:DUF982 domain-containing protein [Ensifer adhaerens]